MTLRELYEYIGGNYDQAIRVLRVEKLMDKHIRRFSDNGLIEKILAAGEAMDPVALFDTAHAAKGVCGNLGLTGLYETSSEIAEEFRPGRERKLSDEEVKEKIKTIEELYRRTSEGIKLYEASAQ